MHMENISQSLPIVTEPAVIVKKHCEEPLSVSRTETRILITYSSITYSSFTDRVSVHLINS